MEFALDSAAGNVYAGLTAGIQALMAVGIDGLGQTLGRRLTAVSAIDPRTPVIVGAGQVTRHREAGDEYRDPVSLAAEARSATWSARTLPANVV